MSGSQGSDAQLDRDAIERAFNALAKRLEELQVRGHIYIVGGAAMVLAHRRSKSTLDVDPLVIDPRGTVLQAAVDVAREQSLPADWLNDKVANIAILPYRPPSKAQVLFDSPYLVVTGASARHMLAMKVRTGCSRDEDDIKLLLRRLKV